MLPDRSVAAQVVCLEGGVIGQKGAITRSFSMGEIVQVE